MRFFKIYQALWLGVAIFTALLFIYNIYSKPRINNDDYIIILISALSFGMYFIKKRNKAYFEKVYGEPKKD